MLVRLSIVTDRHSDALVVPKRALRREADQVFLFVADGEVARKIEVQEGFSDDNHVEVFSVSGPPLAVGMDVIVVGSRDLEDGVAVRVENEQPDDGADEGPGEAAPDESDATPAADSAQDSAPTSSED